MRIAIIGTRGIPNHYGGFEQFAEYLALGLVKKNCEIFVYNSHNHPFKKDDFYGVKIIRKLDPEYKIGTVGQFIYDLNCILHTRKKNYDIILQLGYTSSAIWNFLLPKKSIVITNMDGIEYSRSKYSCLVKKFLKYSEKITVKKSDALVADSKCIVQHLENKFDKKSEFIPYGTEIFENPNSEYLKKYNLKEKRYFLLIARLQPDNNIEMIIEGVLKSDSTETLAIVGNFNNKYGIFLTKKYKNENQLKFLGGIYDETDLNNLRYFSSIYFHGHSAGGTNPSLIEAMACSTFVIAYETPYNKEVLGETVLSFKNSEDIKNQINKNKTNLEIQEEISNNLKTIKSRYLKQQIIDKYFKLFNTLSK